MLQKLLVFTGVGYTFEKTIKLKYENELSMLYVETHCIMMDPNISFCVIESTGDFFFKCDLVLIIKIQMTLYTL